jgi:hypothetical protein
MGQECTILFKPKYYNNKVLDDTIQWSFSSDINVCQSHTMTES